jgi:hypothetical protein
VQSISIHQNILNKNYLSLSESYEVLSEDGDIKKPESFVFCYGVTTE